MTFKKAKVLGISAGAIGQFILFAGLFNADDLFLWIGLVITTVGAFAVPFIARRNGIENALALPFFIASPSLVLAVMSLMDFLSGGRHEAMLFWGGLFAAVYLLGKVGILAAQKSK